jgi:hypothetical protein
MIYRFNCESLIYNDNKSKNTSFYFLLWLLSWVQIQDLELCICLFTCALFNINNKKQTPWLESASELYQPSDRQLSAKLVPTLADRGCHVVSGTVPHGWRVANAHTKGTFCVMNSVTIALFTGPAGGNTYIYIYILDIQNKNRCSV